MDPDKIRRLVIDISEDTRECDNCKKSLSYTNDTLLITIPRSKAVYEFCSWFCLFTHIKQMLKTKILNGKLGSLNLLAKLKYDENEDRIKQRLEDKK